MTRDFLGGTIDCFSFFFFFKQKTAYEIRLSLVGSVDVHKRQLLKEMGIG